MSFLCLSLLQPSPGKNSSCGIVMHILSCFPFPPPPFFISASPLMGPIDTVDYSVAVGEGAGDSGHLKEEWRLEPQLFPHPIVSALPPVTCPHIHQSKTTSISPGLFSLFKSSRIPYVPPASVISLGLILGRKPASEAFWVQKSDSSYFFIEQGTTPRGQEELNRTEPSSTLFMAGRTSERLPWAGQNSCPRARVDPVMVKYRHKETGMVLFCSSSFFLLF